MEENIEKVRPKLIQKIWKYGNSYLREGNFKQIYGDYDPLRRRLAYRSEWTNREVLIENSLSQKQAYWESQAVRTFKNSHYKEVTETYPYIGIFSNDDQTRIAMVLYKDSAAKYILGEDTETGKLVLASFIHTGRWHRNHRDEIERKTNSKLINISGGYLSNETNPETGNTEFKIYGSSEGFGEADHTILNNKFKTLGFKSKVLN